MYLRESLKKDSGKKYNQFKNWYEAFFALEEWLGSLLDGKKIVFFDELPWMDTPRSNFISGSEHFGNSWASARKDILLIAGRSAASWIVNKLINNHVIDWPTESCFIHFCSLNVNNIQKRINWA